MPWTPPLIRWPDQRRFAFTVFDDPDLQADAEGTVVYSFLADLGFRTTRGVWPLAPTRVAPGLQGHGGQPAHIAWLHSLADAGFELGLHNVTMHSSTRQETAEGLRLFERHFGDFPLTLANHMENQEAIYWGAARLSGWQRIIYDLATRGRNQSRFGGHLPDSPFFWGDLCHSRVRYVRNFVFRQTNTLAACPFMPYHDPLRPFVRAWFASSEGGTVDTFVERIRESEQDRLEEEGGVCIMYAHFGKGFVQKGKVHPGFAELMRKLSRRNGYFAPVRTVLDTIAAQAGEHVLTSAERNWLQNRWLWLKLRYGTS